MTLRPAGAPSGAKERDESSGQLFAGCFSSDAAAAQTARLIFVGLADDSQSSYLKGAARGPLRIRHAYTGASYNSASESGVDLAGKVFDAGDITPRGAWALTAAAISGQAAAYFRAGRIPFFAGGDHAVSVPVIAALSAVKQKVHVIQIDAHPDLYPEYAGSKSSHACVAARLLEMPHVASVTQYGIRTMNAPQQAVAREHRKRLHIFQAHVLTGTLPQPAHLPDDAPVFLDIDLDGFDPAYAPGVSHPVPGGISPRQALNFLHAAKFRLMGMSAVELNPEQDEGNRSAILAGRLLHEGMGYALK